jgi:2-methylcitrate dehydratase PrpD
MRIVRELAAERNSVAKIAFLTRLTEATVREALGLAATAGAGVRECLQPTGAPNITRAGAAIPLGQASLRSPMPGRSAARARL